MSRIYQETCAWQDRILHLKKYISATNSAILKMNNIYIKNKADKIILPNEPLSNFQLIDAVKKLKNKNFRGVFIRTDLPKKPRKKKNVE